MCGSDLGDFVECCETCGEPAEKPNVRLANRTLERSALETRYYSAVSDAFNRGASDAAASFDDAMGRTVAVLNVDIYFLRDFISKDGLLYANYHHGVRAKTRKAAELNNDRERYAVDGTLFGSMGEQIITAALSLECRGLVSYGSYSMQLRDIAVAKRATVLEENSFMFVRRHNILPNVVPPAGYSSTWKDRNELACAKLLPRVTAATLESEFQSILLSSTGERQTDEFLEVHIYGTFDNKAVEKVSAPAPTDPVDIAIWAIVKEILTKNGKPVEEY